MRRAAALLVPVALLGCASGGGAPGPSGTWSGSFRLPARAEAVAISVEVRGRSAVVALASGHAARTTVPVRATAGRLRFSLPSRSGAIRFDLRLQRGRLAGPVRQGAARGTASVSRGRALEDGTLGLYRFADGRELGAVSQGFWPRGAILYGADEVRATYRTRPGTYAIGSGLATRAPSVGTATFAAGHTVWRGERAERVPLRQEEVRVPAGRHVLGCTLTIPPGEGPRGAVAFAHGSGPSLRKWTSPYALFYAARGLVTLACDKRGIGQSGGIYPGEGATPTSADAYARDVEAQARWLARQPEVDPARVGVGGMSQAGWIIPLAAAREPAVRFVLVTVGPTYTTDEDDVWGDRSGQGEWVPTEPDEAIEADMRASRGGFDPLPSIRALRIPGLWLFGGRDRHVSTPVSLERLDPVAREAGRDLSYVVFPRANHGLIETETRNALNEEMLRSSRFAEGLWATIEAWLRSRGLSSPS